jgi:hypothetical protein
MQSYVFSLLDYIWRNDLLRLQDPYRYPFRCVVEYLRLMHNRTCRVMNGINAPKLIECLGSDGQRYKQLAKSGNDDLRQDAVSAVSILTPSDVPKHLTPAVACLFVSGRWIFFKGTQLYYCI